MGRGRRPHRAERAGAPAAGLEQVYFCPAAQRQPGGRAAAGTCHDTPTLTQQQQPQQLDTLHAV